MKHLEKLLQNGSVKPNRPLRSDFTKQTMQKIAEGSNRSGRFATWKEHVYMKFQKPALIGASLLSTLLIGGTVYAVANWPQVSSIFGGEKQLASGNRIVGVDTENCQYSGPQAASDAKEKNYYEIKKDSALTNEQVVDMILGICESNVINNKVNEIIKPFAGRGEAAGLEGGTTYQIKAVTGNSLTMTLDKQYMRGDIERTFTRFAPDLQVYDGNQSTDFSTLKAGDTVSIVIRYAASANPEQTDPTRDNTNLQTVVAIIKHPPLKGSPDVFFSHLGRDFVRTEPCDTDPAGFCRSYDFAE